MENFEKTKLFDCEALRQEIADLKVAEMARKEENPSKYNPHFDEIDPDALKEQDLRIYKDYKDGTLTKEELAIYQKSFKNIENENDSRLNFMAWIVNQTTTPEWLKKLEPKDYKKYFGGKEKSH